MFKLTPVTSKIGQGHSSSNLTKTLLRYIHGISLGPMRLIFVELSCLQAKCWRTDRRTDGRTDRRTDGDGHANLIVGLVTRNPPNNVIDYKNCKMEKEYYNTINLTRLLGRPQPQMYPPVALNQYTLFNRTHKHFIYIYASRPHKLLKITPKLNNM